MDVPDILTTDSSLRTKFREDLLVWSEGNIRDFPWRDPEASTHEVLIAELLLRLTFASKVEPIYSDIVSKYPDMDSLGKADEEDLIKLLTPLGLQNRRVEALMEIAELLEDEKIPDSKDALLEIPHVGKYTANAVACFSWNENRPLVDTNILRIYSRIFGFSGDRDQRDSELWKFADWMLPPSDVRRYNLALLDFGAKHCTAQNPNCGTCFANGYCNFYLTEKDD